MPLLPVTLMALGMAVTGEDEEECYQMRSQYKRVKLYHTSQCCLFSPLFPSNVGRLKKVCIKEAVQVISRGFLLKSDLNLFKNYY